MFDPVPDVLSDEFGNLSVNVSVVIVELGAFGNNGIRRIGSVGIRRVDELDNADFLFCVESLSSLPSSLIPMGTQKDVLMASDSDAGSFIVEFVVVVVVVGS